jgi:hypothetical protein
MLSALGAALCAALCACRHTPSSDTTEEATLAEEPTLSPETQPSDENTVFCLYEYFPDNTNFNGNLLGSSETDESGDIVYGYPSPDRVPVTDRSNLYGTTYRFSLTAHTDKHLFCFRYDTTTNRLEVVIPCERISLFLIFLVEGIKDGDSFVRSVEDGEYLSATLLYARNIDVLRAWGLQGAFSHLADQPTSALSYPRYDYILGYAISDRTYLESTWDNHDAFRWMDEIVSLYGEEPS